jgi:hypothetical protein
VSAQGHVEGKGRLGTLGRRQRAGIPPTDEEQAMVKLLTGRNGGRASAPPPTVEAYDIEQEAYLLAEQRGFEPGRALDDWLLAESRFVDREAGHKLA